MRYGGLALGGLAAAGAASGPALGAGGTDAVEASTAGAALRPAGMYLAIEDVPGDATRRGYEGQLVVTSWGWSGETPMGSGGQLGSPSLGPVVFTRPVDVGTPRVLDSFAVRRNFPMAELTVLESEAGKAPTPRVVVRFGNAQVVGFETTIAGDSAVERFSLRSQSVEYEHRPPGGEPVVFTYDPTVA